MTRTYEGYGKALKGAYKQLDPEEKLAIEHTVFIVFVLSQGLGYSLAQFPRGEIVLGGTVVAGWIYWLKRIADLTNKSKNDTKGDT